MTEHPRLSLLIPDRWTDYQLLDSGEGQKLERFGPYRLIRPEAQALWRRTLPRGAWDTADGAFLPASEEERDGWHFQRPVEQRWAMGYGGIRFWAAPTPFRHLGLFPEQASHWDWLSALIEETGRSTNVLNLFAYTGLATLVAARAGARVTHVDASRKTVGWARENQALSALDDRPIRWIVDDALKFVRREARRGAQYDGLIIDPPPFGRGPKGEIWRLEESLPALLDECRALLSPRPLFVLLTVYAVKLSALGLYYALGDMLAGYDGTVSAGELVTQEESGGRLLSAAIYARWSAPPRAR